MIRYNGREIETTSIELSVDSVFTINTPASAKDLDDLTEDIEVELVFEEEDYLQRINTTDYSDIHIEEGKDGTVLTLGYVSPFERAKRFMMEQVDAQVMKAMKGATK